MFNVILYQPEIPPNTGAIIRLCANTGASLHLIEPLGFAWDDRRMRRAGLDYGEWARVARHRDFRTARQQLQGRWSLLTTRGQVRCSDFRFQPGDCLLFGNETIGVPDSVRTSIPSSRHLTLPMVPGGRSLNLANTVAVTVYEAWRQLGFDGAGGLQGPPTGAEFS